MAKHYYIKEILGGSILIQGTRVPFEPLDGDQGVIVLDDTIPQDKVFIEGLNGVLGKYGIAKMTEGEYSSKKSAYPYSEAKLQLKARDGLLQLHQAAEDRPNPLSKSVGVAAGSLTSRIQAKPDAMQLAAEMTAPTPLTDSLSDAFKPATGRPRGRPPKQAVA